MEELAGGEDNKVDDEAEHGGDDREEDPDGVGPAIKQPEPQELGGEAVVVARDVRNGVVGKVATTSRIRMSVSLNCSITNCQIDGMDCLSSLFHP